MRLQSQSWFTLVSPQGHFAESALTFGTNEGLDSLEQLALADAADRSLLRLVMCAAGFTLAVALASSLV